MCNTIDHYETISARYRTDPKFATELLKEREFANLFPNKKLERIVQQQIATEQDFEDFPLQGTVLHYENPFDPVVFSEEWNANN